LQQGGQQQPPMMQNPQMSTPMPELSFEQWKQMQMSQQMPQQSVNTGIYGGPSPAFNVQQQQMQQQMSNPQQYQPMMPYKR
jgi:hypothetical protein